MEWIGSIAAQKRRASVTVGSMAPPCRRTPLVRQCQYGEMDQDLTWWAEVVFDGWRDRPGPRYARLAAALLEAIDTSTVTRGTRVPAERTLAAVTGTSRGTVVACFDQLAEAGVLIRRQGAG